MKNARETDVNWAQIRDRIDRGEAGDKKAVEDPAAAPLGTDAEAGGSPTGAEHVARSAAAEQAGRRRVPRRRAGLSRDPVAPYLRWGSPRWRRPSSSRWR